MVIARKLLQCIFALTLSTAAWASDKAATYEVTHDFSNVNFSITKFFFKEDGGFRDFSGEIVYDPDHPERSHVQMTVQAASIDTRNDGRDRVLRSDDFFDVARYPTLSFVSTSVRPRQDGTFDVAGDLTIHGVTRHVTIGARFLGMKQMQGWGDFVGFDAEFTIDRTDFGVNGLRWAGGTPVLGKEVDIHLSIGAVRQGSK